MSLQNRVLPDGQIVAESWRGTFMGNKGGRIHNPETRTLLNRKWASRRWIICVTEFKNRQRKVMGNSYTELFFLDEVSALSSGHRPCFECRREDANAFAETWVAVYGKPDGSMADAMDRQLHGERTGEKKTLTFGEACTLPDGVMIKTGEYYFAKKDDEFLQWTGEGYQQTKLKDDKVILQTPLSIINVLRAGFKPSWHKSADQGANHDCS